jgi:cation:H+ antiporter
MIESFIMAHPLLFYGIATILSLIILAKSADMLVYGISSYAKKLGISDYLIGFLVVSVGTALPELVASINGAFMNQAPIIFGTIIGSNLFKIPLLGVVILIAGKVKINVNNIGTAPIMTFILGILPVLLVIDGNLSRIDGIILAAAYLIYIANLWQKEGELGKIKESVPLKEIIRESFIFLGALVALLLSAKYLVFSSTEISNIIHIPTFIIGLIVIGVGASAPELMVQVRSILEHHKGIAIGNVLGSIVANSTLVLGIVALIHPVTIVFKDIFFTSLMMGIGTLYILIAMFRGPLTKRHALIMIIGYIIAIVIETII